MDTEIKAKREQFITGHHGGTFLEIVLLTNTLQLSHILYSSFMHACPALHKSTFRIKIIRYFLDFFLNYTPFLLSVSICSDYIPLIFATIVMMIIINFVIYLRNEKSILCWKKIKTIHVVYSNNRLPYVSNLMSALLLATCIAILAVDFPIFDRRFAKTELFGWSLMDVGVGGFLAINAALSPESRLAHIKDITLSQRIIKSFRSTIPLLILGFARLAAVKYLNYQEHVTEYGVHWNFFFTIAFSKLFSAILCAILDLKRINLLLIALLIATIHQTSLFYGLSEFIQNDNRSTIISANKEGFISTIGSVALYILFVYLGRIYLLKRKIFAELIYFLKEISIICIISISVMFTCHWYIEPVSRRETNISYILFMISFVICNFITELLYFMFSQVLQASNAKYNSNKFESIVFGWIAKTGLLIFLTANILTGFVNFTVDTLQTTKTQTMLILYLYSFLLSFVCYILTRLGIKV